MSDEAGDDAPVKRRRVTEDCLLREARAEHLLAAEASHAKPQLSKAGLVSLSAVEGGAHVVADSRRLSSLLEGRCATPGCVFSRRLTRSCSLRAASEQEQQKFVSAFEAHLQDEAALRRALAPMTTVRKFGLAPSWR
jgi:hypothetical protein